MSTPLNSEEIEQALTNLPDWEFSEDALSKTFTFGSFREAMSYMVRVSFDQKPYRKAMMEMFGAEEWPSPSVRSPGRYRHSRSRNPSRIRCRRSRI